MVVRLRTEGNDKVKARLTKYLTRDETGIRRFVLKLFLNGGKYTTHDVYNLLTKNGFDVNYRGVSAMVGIMNARLGILRIDVKGNHNVYSLKNEYRNALKTIMANYG